MKKKSNIWGNLNQNQIKSGPLIINNNNLKFYIHHFKIFQKKKIVKYLSKRRRIDCMQK